MSNITLWTRRDPFSEFDALQARFETRQGQRDRGATRRLRATTPVVLVGVSCSGMRYDRLQVISSQRVDDQSVMAPKPPQHANIVEDSPYGRHVVGNLGNEADLVVHQFQPDGLNAGLLLTVNEPVQERAADRRNDPDVSWIAALGEPTPERRLPRDSRQ